MSAAKSKKTSVSASTFYKLKSKKSRKGIHSKTKMSKNKGSKNYTKISIGQN